MYAVISTGGKQYKLNQGDVFVIEKVDGEVGEKVEFDSVLYLSGEEELKLGSPTVDGAKVVGTILEQSKGDKVTIFKFKRRKMYRRKTGHRQLLTKIRVESIEGISGSQSKASVKKEEPAAKKEASSPKKAEKTAPKKAKAKQEPKKVKPKAKAETAENKQEE
jgi:large subunit ribosomal protein L21